MKTVSNIKDGYVILRIERSSSACFQVPGVGFSSCVLVTSFDGLQRGSSVWPQNTIPQHTSIYYGNIKYPCQLLYPMLRPGTGCTPKITQSSYTLYNTANALNIPATTPHVQR